jgi:hypothetical protein
VRGTAAIPKSQMCETIVILPTAGNSTVQCWGVQLNNVHKKSIKICQIHYNAETPETLSFEKPTGFLFKMGGAFA